MVRSFGLVFALFFLSCTVPTVSPAPVAPLPSITNSPVGSYKPVGWVSKMYDATVSVMTVGDDKVSVIGAGVVLKCEAGSPRIVMTAAHVANAIYPQGGMALVGDLGRTKLTVMKLLSKNDLQDLALLEGIVPEETACPAAQLSKRLPGIGAPVYVIGSPDRKERTITHGLLSNVLEYNGTQIYQTDATVFFGNSGGPMFNSDGEVIGIIVSLRFRSLPFFMIIPGSGQAVALPHLWDLVKNTESRICI